MSVSFPFSRHLLVSGLATLTLGLGLAGSAVAQSSYGQMGAGQAGQGLVDVPIAGDAAPATPAKPRGKPRAKPAAKLAVQAKLTAPKGKILVINNRLVTLTELTMTPTGTKVGASILVATDLPAGQQLTATLPPKAGCVFVLSGTFEDEASIDVPAQNLCKDGVIKLVE